MPVKAAKFLFTTLNIRVKWDEPNLYMSRPFVDMNVGIQSVTLNTLEHDSDQMSGLVTVASVLSLHLYVWVSVCVIELFVNMIIFL